LILVDLVLLAREQLSVSKYKRWQPDPYLGV
jgi:hypothetical protein